jgi:hypothetical protein
MILLKMWQLSSMHEKSVAGRDIRHFAPSFPISSLITQDITSPIKLAIFASPTRSAKHGVVFWTTWPDWDSHKQSRIDGILIVTYETAAHLLLGYLNAHPRAIL